MIVSNPSYTPGQFHPSLSGLSGLDGLGDAFENCQPAYGIPDPACLARNFARQQQQMEDNNIANRSVFVDNCEHDWEMNAAIYSALKLPIPANTCNTNKYGLTYADSGVNTFANVAKETNFTPVINVPVLTPQTPAKLSTPVLPSTPPTNKPITKADASIIDTLLPSVPDSFTQDINIMGHQIPAWVIGAAALSALVFLGGKV